MPNQFNFLTEYVIQLLEDNGFKDLNEKQKNVYIPQMQTRVEERLGLHFLPLLNESQTNKFAELVQNQNVDTNTWQKFWQESISDFDEQVKLVLAGFAEEVKQILAR